MTRVISSRVDALVVAYQGGLKGGVRDLLTERLADAQTVRTDVEVQIDGMAFELSARSRPGTWFLRHLDARLKFDDADYLDGWRLEVTAEHLAERGPLVAVALARHIADAFVELVNGERIRRIDLCADIVGLELEEIDRRAWLTPPRAGCSEWGDHSKGENRTGFTIGKRGNAMYARIYDKLAELTAKGDDEKRAIEEWHWRRGGWDGLAAVARVEFEILGDGLKEFGHREDPEQCLACLPALWAYCTRDWLKLIVPETATRRRRCRTDDRWRTVQSAVFGDFDGEVAVRRRLRGCGDLRRAFSSSLRAPAAAGVLLPSFPGARGHKVVENWSDEKCIRFVNQAAIIATKLSGPLMADALIIAKGPKLAAAWVIEKQNAAIAHSGRTPPRPILKVANE